MFVAIPAYDRKIACETAAALLDEQAAANAAGIALHVAFVSGCCYVDKARNQLVRDFLVSDAERLVFVDADVCWAPGSLLKIATAKPDFVGGCYRHKRDEETYPIEWIADRAELWSDPETGLIEVAALPGGFLSLSRSVFERMLEAYPGRAYAHEGHIFNAFFHQPFGWGEDGRFCAEWREIGGQVWLDPLLDLTHVDAAGRQYRGCIGDWLRRRMQPEQEQGPSTP